jgi:formylglycine-generating enzyme required for sulfatase activity
VSWEDEKLSHGVFMHYLLEGLQGEAANRGQVTLVGLYEYASLNTKKYVDRRFSDLQTPALKGEINGPFEICTATHISTATLPGRTPVTPSQMPSAGGTITNSIGMKLVLIPAGEFQMGSWGSDDKAGSDEKPQHRVRITKPFYVGQYPVTLGEFLTFYHDANYKLEMERDGEESYGYDESGQTVKSANFRPWAPGGWKPEMDHPVVWVTRNDAVAFCEWLSKKEGKEYRLPSEAQWEYACRAGSMTRYSFGDSENELGVYAWYNNQGGIGTHPVGSKRPNAWRLYDMHGNVWQWCADWYTSEYYAASPADDPQGPDSGLPRVLRGGGWDGGAGDCRSASRIHFSPGDRSYDLGFRVALVPADK